MQAGICAICDTDTAYLARLVAFLENRRHLPFEVQPFSDPEALCQFAGNRRLEVLLIAPGLWSEALRKLDIGVVFALWGGNEEEKLPEGSVRLDKYQSADALLRQVMDHCAELFPPGHGEEPVSSVPGGPGDSEGIAARSANLQHMGSPGRKQSTSPGLSASVYQEESALTAGSVSGETAPGLPAKVIGVYSPLGRCGKTTLALCLGMALAGEKKTIYLNLEEYHGFSFLTGLTEASDLSDLLYLMRAGEPNLPLRLGGMLQSWDDLDYLPPPFSGYDLKDVGALEWQALMRLLGISCGYEVIVVDVGTRLEDVFGFLRCCDHIFVPALEDAFSKAKLRQFEENMEALGFGRLRERIRYVHPPDVSGQIRRGGFPGRIARGQAGQYARQLVLSEKLTGEAGKRWQGRL